MNNLRTVTRLLKCSIEEMFNKWEAAKPLRTGAPHASAILAPESEWCLRKQVLSALYPEEARRPDVKPWDAHQNALFLNGWSLHEKYQKLFSEHGQVVEVEHSHFDETRYLHYTPDAIIMWGGSAYVVEIKGYNTAKFESLDETGEPPDAAWKQANLYCHVLGIERGLVLVENKNTQHMKVWVIEQDAEMAAPYLGRMYSVKGHVLTKRVPERKCASINDRQAQKCPMRDLCFSRRLQEK